MTLLRNTARPLALFFVLLLLSIGLLTACGEDSSGENDPTDTSSDISSDTDEMKDMGAQVLAEFANPAFQLRVRHFLAALRFDESTFTPNGKDTYTWTLYFRTADSDEEWQTFPVTLIGIKDSDPATEGDARTYFFDVADAAAHWEVGVEYEMVWTSQRNGRRVTHSFVYTDWTQKYANLYADYLVEQ